MTWVAELQFTGRPLHTACDLSIIKSNVSLDFYRIAQWRETQRNRTLPEEIERPPPAHRPAQPPNHPRNALFHNISITPKHPRETTPAEAIIRDAGVKSRSASWWRQLNIHRRPHVDAMLIAMPAALLITNVVIIGATIPATRGACGGFRFDPVRRSHPGMSCARSFRGIASTQMRTSCLRSREKQLTSLCKP